MKRELWKGVLSDALTGNEEPIANRAVAECLRSVARSGAENTIWGKVVASPEFGLWCVLWSKVLVACPNTQGCPGNVN